jgi:hypothetical protein
MILKLEMALKTDCTLKLERGLCKGVHDLDVVWANDEAGKHLQIKWELDLEVG